jgi:WD40 repeat protein
MAICQRDDEPADVESTASGMCGGYLLEKEIGRGGTGVVFLARDPAMGRQVALKRPAARFAGPDEIRRFRIEVESVAGLEHPNIVPVHAAGEEDGQPYFVMKHASGGTLQDVLRSRGGTVDVATRVADVEVVVKIARAVQFAHERGVLHRDLKPANILLDDRGEPLVSDFGLARLLHAPSGGTITGSALGTPAYMAPEQATGGEVTTAADVYGLGAILYHLLAGRPPYDGATPMETLKRVATEEVVDPRGLVEGLDVDLSTVCLSALNRDSSRRYVSAKAFAEDLERWLRHEPVLARRAGAGERLMKWAKRRPALAALSLSSLVALIAFLMVLTSGRAMLMEERNHAMVQERLARKNAKRAEDTAEAFRQHAYAADVYLASRALGDGQLGVARGLLERHVPAAGQSDLRGFEWYVFHRRCQGSEVKRFDEHQAAVTAVSFDPSCKLIASAGRDGRLMVRKTDDGVVVLDLPKADAPTGAAEIPMMSLLAARSPEVAAKVLRGELGPDEMRMRARPSNLGELTSLAWSPDGTRLACGAVGAFLRIWKFPEGDLEAFLPLVMVRQVAFSKDGSLLVSMIGSGDTHEVRVHRVANLMPVHVIPDVQSAFALMGDRLATVNSGTLQVEVTDLATMKVVDRWPAGGGVSGLAFSPDLMRLHALSADGVERFYWEVEEGRRVDGDHWDGGGLKVLAISEDGASRIFGGSGQAICVEGFSDHGGRRMMRGHEDEILALDVSSDGRWIASGSNDKTVRIWRADQEVEVEPGSIQNDWNCAGFSSDGTKWVSQSKDGRVFLCEFGKPGRELVGGDTRNALGFDSDGGRFCTWRRDGLNAVIEWWDVETMERESVISVAVRTDGPWVLHLTNRGKWCVIVASRAPVQVVDLKNGSLVHRFPRPRHPVLRISTTLDGSRIAAFSWPRSIQVGEVGGGLCEEWKLGAGTVGPVVFSPDGKWLASGGDDNLVSVRDARNGELIRTLSGHLSQIRSLAFTPDGKTLASAGADGTIRLWHTATWRSLGTLEDGSHVSYLHFMDNQHLLAVPLSGKVERISGRGE